MKTKLFFIGLILLPSFIWAGQNPYGILELEGYGTSDAVGITSKRGRNDFTIKETLASGDKFFFIKGYGYNGTTFGTNPSASIEFSASQAWTSTANGSKIVFKTTPNGSITPGTALTIDNDGSITLAGNVILSSVSLIDAYNNSFGSVTSGSTSTLTWTEIIDREAEFVTSSFTATTTGYYEVIAHAGASQTAGTGCLLLKVNGTTIAGGDACITGATALATVLDVSMNRILSLTAGDIVRIDASATSANVTFQKMDLTIKRLP